MSLTMKGVIVRDLEAGGKMPTSFDGYQILYPNNLLMCLFDYDVTPRCIGLIKKYGLKKIRFHDLRHTCASLLLANGVPMKQIQIWLGHSNFSTTADIYAHLDMSAQIQTGCVAGALFGQDKSLS